jgi:hypothetical protein
MVMTQSMIRGIPLPVPALLLAAFLFGGCAEDVTKLSEVNNLQVVSVPDTFTVDIEEMENLVEELSWDWEVTTTTVHVEHRSFVPHGENAVRIRDADGTVVYTRKLLFDLEGESEAGTPGTWTVELDLFGVTGRVGLTLTGIP